MQCDTIIYTAAVAVGDDTFLMGISQCWHEKIRRRLHTFFISQVVRNYTAKAAARFDSELAMDSDPIRVWIRVLRETVSSDNRICPCIVLAAAGLDLPEEVNNEVKTFFQMLKDKLQAAGLSETATTEFLATILGAQVLAITFNDVACFDAAMNSRLTEGRPQQR